MNWSKALIGGLAAGVVVWLVDFLLHGIILGNTYAGYEVFQVEPQPSPFTFLWIEIAIFICVAILFAKTFDCWGGGWKGGAKFGLYFGIAVFFTGFFSAVVIKGFPYFLVWCQAGASLIAAIVGGAIIGLIYKPA